MHVPYSPSDWIGKFYHNLWDLCGLYHINVYPLNVTFSSIIQTCLNLKNRCWHRYLNPFSKFLKLKFNSALFYGQMILLGASNRLPYSFCHPGSCYFSNIGLHLILLVNRKIFGYSRTVLMFDRLLTDYHYKITFLFRVTKSHYIFSVMGGVV
jgi:hypothetical protein